MPIAARRKSGPTSGVEPYPKSSPKNSKEKPDKENVDPNNDIARSKSSSQTSKDTSNRKKSDSTSKSPDNDHGNYRDIPLDKVKGEVPC